MKWTIQVLLCVVSVYVLYRIAMLLLLFVLFSLSRPSPPLSFAEDLFTDRAVYSQVDTVGREELGLYAYDFDRNKYVNALPNSASKSNIADSAGNFPAFKLGEDVFVITSKGRGNSSGLAISDDPGFKKKIEAIDDVFKVHHVWDDVYQWKLDFD